ncbi:hypothetical protein HYALB_00006472 [Hymenoscyphus albidus]|uniref:Mid2 domain-containing protein n=1 Tax=Hymenoscyphus albidus TaxID=595503 RepID=A0A9N9LL17_9HELO|nr:hypothetical protein HYALB_00006472 [Hymenoscyphus albidus]
MDPKTNSPFTIHTPLWSCAQPGLKEFNYCCGFDDKVSCCNASFFLPGTGSAFQAGNDALASSLRVGGTTSPVTVTTVVSATNSPIATPEASNTKSESNPSASENSDLGTKLGLGIGVPLGILVLGLLATLFWWIQRQTAHGMHLRVNSHNNKIAEGSTGAYSDVYRHNMEIQSSHNQPQSSFEPIDPIYEAPAQVDPRELPH